VSGDARIATASVEEGLDFACNLIAFAIVDESGTRPEAAPLLLSILATYVRLRYVGEPEEALEQLATLANSLSCPYPRTQFWSQLRWIAGRLDLPPDKQRELEIPNA
jgi:hypothetical protein